MKTALRLLAVTALLLASARLSSANAIVNGSFEDPFLASGWQTYSSIPGWEDLGPGDLLEIGLAGVYGVSNHHGRQVMELDVYQNAIVNHVGVIPAGNYTLSFLYSDRTFSRATSSFEVWWNGAEIADLNPALLVNPLVMTLFQANVVAGAVNTLEFRATGNSDTYGAIIDDVQLNAVPDGGLTSALLGLGIVGLGIVRRIVG